MDIDRITLGVAVDSADAIAKLDAVVDAAKRATEAIEALNTALDSHREPTILNVEVRDPQHSGRRYA